MLRKGISQDSFPKPLPKIVPQSTSAKPLLQSGYVSNLKATPQSYSSKCLPKAAPQSCVLKLFPRIVVSQSFCCAKLFLQAIPTSQNCSPKLLPKAAPQSCSPKQSRAPKFQSCYRKLLQTAAPQSC